MQNELSPTAAVDELLIRNKEAQSVFECLLDDAVDICLQNSDEFVRLRDQYEDEYRIFTVHRNLGVWSARASLELELNDVIYASTEDDTMNYQSLKEKPNAFLPDADPSVQAGIEAFGQVLLDEAFLCLGEGADEQAEKFRNATEVDQQTQIIDWLIARIDDINKAYRSKVSDTDTEDFEITITDIPELSLEAQESITVPVSREVAVVDLSLTPATETPLPARHFYHPARLSPKLLGKYPDIQLDPTCLSVSLLLASFFEKAGTAYLHAGVMHTSSEMSRSTLADMADTIALAAEAQQITLQNEVYERLVNIVVDEERIINRDAGYHAAVYARLVDGSWEQLDYNYDNMMSLSGFESVELDKAYEKLAQAYESSRGVEVSHPSATGCYLDYFADVLIRLSEARKPDEELEAALQGIEQSDNIIEAVGTYILEEFCKILYEDEEPVMEEIVDSVLNRRGLSGRAKVREVDDMLDRVASNFVFSDVRNGEERDARLRLTADGAYRQRRREDLQMAPMYFALALSSKIANTVVKGVNEGGAMPHASVELGLPVYRIGAAVLSDFALYTETELPFSFWASNWTSYVTYSSHVPDKQDKDQVQLMQNLLAATDRRCLSYISSRGIIREFLEQNGRMEHDNQQE